MNLEAIFVEFLQYECETIVERQSTCKEIVVFFCGREQKGFTTEII